MGVARITRTPVLIVGSGPVGLTLAADLGWRGIPCTVVEQGEAKIGPAKMILVSVRSMEICRRLGFSEKVVNWGFPRNRSLDNVFVTGLQGYEIGRIAMPTMGEYGPSRYSPEAQAYCPQTWFDPIVRDFAASQPEVTLRYQTRLESFEQSDRGVRAVVIDLVSGQREYIHADFLVGCDGNTSPVRHALDIAMRGHPHLDNSINVELTIPSLAAHHDKGDAGRFVLVGQEGTWATLITVDGRDLWRITLYGVDETDPKSTDLHVAIRRALGEGVAYEIKSVGHWVRRAVVADRFQDGRVFLAGDACHTHPPNGGFGMNTGLGDAADLAWKLAAHFAGWGGQWLLSSYDDERRPACHRAMEESLSNYGRLVGGTIFADIEKATMQGDRLRRELGRKLSEDNTKAWRPVGIHLGLSYDPSPIIFADGSPRPEDDRIGYLPTSRPGSRAPHAWLPDGRSTLDLFGRGFSLLRFGRVPVDETPLTRAARRSAFPVAVHDISDRNIADLYEAKLVLVRPDGHVAWRGNSVPSAPDAVLDKVRGATRPAAGRYANFSEMSPLVAAE